MFTEAAVRPSSVLDRVWSDPQVGSDVALFEEYVSRNCDGSSVRVEEVSEYLCEWSRGLFNRAFGRTTPAEFEHITGMFVRTADAIQKLARNVHDPEELARIEAFALHIRNRTGFHRVQTD
jgi:hypothetical protein